MPQISFFSKVIRWYKKKLESCEPKRGTTLRIGSARTLIFRISTSKPTRTKCSSLEPFSLGTSFPWLWQTNSFCSHSSDDIYDKRTQSRVTGSLPSRPWHAETLSHLLALYYYRIVLEILTQIMGKWISCSSFIFCLRPLPLGGKYGSAPARLCVR